MKSPDDGRAKSGWGKDIAVSDKQDNIPDYRTVLIQRTVRSGQVIRYPGNIVVMGDINPGAEVVAGGNIIVMGSLRGIAHAGAGGNKEAVVAAFRLRPTQLRIANHITRSPDGEEVAPEQPEIAYIKDGVVLIDPYVTSGEGHLSVFNGEIKNRK